MVCRPLHQESSWSLTGSLWPCGAGQGIQKCDVTSLSGALSSPFLDVPVLATLAVVLHRYCIRAGASPAASGAIVMAGGIAALDALQAVPLPVSGLTQLAALGLIVVWFAIARSYLAAAMAGIFSTYLTNPVDSFAIGTWIAGTSVLGQIILLALPGWRSVAIAAWLVAFLLWLWFVAIVVRGFRSIVASPSSHCVTGRILLSTVSTQSVAILTIWLFPGFVPRWLLTGLVALGYASYGVGVLLVAERYLHQRGWGLADHWDNTNCIVHGALFITGLAALLTGALPTPWIVGTWLWGILMFVVIEGIEIARAMIRVRVYGWRRGLFTYDVSQWARNFTFGMFYALSVHLQAPLLTRDGFAWLLPLRALVVSNFQYTVIALFFVEAALFAFSNVRLRYDVGKNENTKGVVEAGIARLSSL